MDVGISLVCRIKYIDIYFTYILVYTLYTENRK